MSQDFLDSPLGFLANVQLGELPRRKEIIVQGLGSQVCESDFFLQDLLLRRGLFSMIIVQSLELFYLLSDHLLKLISGQIALVLPSAQPLLEFLDVEAIFFFREEHLGVLNHSLLLHRPLHFLDGLDQLAAFILQHLNQLLRLGGLGFLFLVKEFVFLLDVLHHFFIFQIEFVALLCLLLQLPYLLPQFLDYPQIRVQLARGRGLPFLPLLLIRLILGLETQEHVLGLLDFLSDLCIGFLGLEFEELCFIGVVFEECLNVVELLLELLDYFLEEIFFVQLRQPLYLDMELHLLQQSLEYNQLSPQVSNVVSLRNFPPFLDSFHLEIEGPQAVAE